MAKRFCFLLVLAALTAIAEALEANVDMTPPELDPEIEKVARTALGI